MSAKRNSAASIVALLKKKNPAYLDLMTAETEEDFEKAFGAILGQAISDLESDSKNFKTLGEEGLTGVLARGIQVPGLTVTRETNSNGHVDLMIVAGHLFPVQKKLFEAKIYDGPDKHIKGLEQLLGRYTTGREGRGVLVVYFRKQNISGLIKNIRARMDAEKPAKQQGDTESHDHIPKWSFLSRHAHSCGDVLAVAHVGCNLYNDDDAADSGGQAD